MVNLHLNIVTFVPKDSDEPRIFINENLDLNELTKYARVNIYVNGTNGISEVEVRKMMNYAFSSKFDSLNISEDPKPLGYCRNRLMYASISYGATHIINLDDDDYLMGVDCINRVISKLPNKFIYIQRYKDGKFYPSVANDTADYILHGKFISNGYACMVMPVKSMIKYRISFPEMLDTYEDNMFFMNLLMKYNKDFVLLANPYYRQYTHPEGEFSMTTKASDKLMKEEYRFVDFLTKFDSYVPNFSKIVECHGEEVYELDKSELIKFEKLYGYTPTKNEPTISLLTGQLISGPRDSIKVTLGVPEMTTLGGLRLQIARIVTLKEFLEFNSYYTTYRLISKYDENLKDLRDAIKARYFDKTPIPERMLNIRIIMLTSWDLLSE